MPYLNHAARAERLQGVAPRWSALPVKILQGSRSASGRRHSVLDDREGWEADVDRQPVACDPRT